MIQHIVGKIVKRKRPPTALFYLSEFCRTTEVIDQFDNDDTIDLLIQLRSALLVCHNVGLSAQVLMQSEPTPTASPVSSRSNSPAPSPRLGSPSRSADGVSTTIPNVFSKNDKRTDFETILQILSDLILNDSRYKTANPKPSRPPFTMQTILVDIAILLVQIREDSAGLYSIGTVYLPAFEAFSEGNMLGKLLSMYLDNLLPKLMKCKDEPKSQPNADLKKPSKSDVNKSPSRLKTPQSHMTPTINIQSPEPESNHTPLKMSHLTIDTRPLPVEANGQSSPRSPAAQSTQSSVHGPPENYHAYALFTPLLYFMIQYLDPYLAAQPSKNQQDNLNYTLTRQANSIHNFHRALSYMMSCKPDLYLDILQVISHSSAEVKFRACQILFYYYFASVGHVIVADPLPLLGTREELEVLDERREQQEIEEARQGNRNGTVPFNHVTKRQQQSDVNSVDENHLEDCHIWYPHMFKRKRHQSMDSDGPFTSFPIMVHDDSNESFCKECFRSIQGFGLRCFQCKESVHYDCSSDVGMTNQGIFSYLKAGNIQKVVVAQFCRIPPQPRFRDMVNRGMLGWTMKSNSVKVGLLGHMFHLVNLHTLTLCACCGLPLWGVSLQAYRCEDCNRFVHPHCLAEAEEKNSFAAISRTKKIKSQQFERCTPNQQFLETDIKINQIDLSESLQEFYLDSLPRTEDSLEGRSYEEIGTMANILMLQENILNNGVKAGCVIINRETDDPLLTVTSHQQSELKSTSTASPSVGNGDGANHCPCLSKAIQFCISYLKSGRCRGSTFLNDFYNNQEHDVDECILSKEEYLGHLGAMMKCLTTSFVSGSSVVQSSSMDNRRSLGDARGFLQVTASPYNVWEDEDDEFSEGLAPSQNLDRSVLLSWVMTNLNFKSRKTAELFLQQMRNLGLFERFDASPILFSLENNKSQLAEVSEKAVQCIFPVPYAIDCSSTVETLINSIGACLQDADLSINECGLLLLVRRCWPDPFLTGYTMERLVHAIVSWVLDEDERLLTLHAELTSHNKSAMSHHKQQNKWAQAALLSRMKNSPNGTDRQRQSAFFHNTTAGVSSGASNMYVTTRAALKDRYVMRWLETIHDMDKNAYTEMLYNAMDAIIDSKRENCEVPNWSEPSNTKKHVLQKYEQLIGYILKLKTNGITFSSLDPLIQKWLDHTHMDFNGLGVLQDKEPVDIRQLAKMCSTRPTISKVPGSSSPPEASTHPLDIITSQFSAGNKDSMARGMRWLALVVHSGTGIPTISLQHIAELIVTANMPLDIVAEFLKVIWFQIVNVLNVPSPRTAIADIVGYLNEAVLDNLSALNGNQNISDNSLRGAQEFVKYSSALSCYAFGCPLENISEIGIVPHVGDHVANISQSKRNALQGESKTMPVDETNPIIRCMLSCLELDQLNVCEDVVKMFYGLCHWGYCIEDMDDFIKKCMPQLIPFVWELLSPTYDYLSSINLTLLMKLISVDVRYFQAVVFKVFEDANWEVRYQGLDNLFGLFTKMDAAFQTEWLKLLSHLGPVFSYFVGCLWDKEEYVRSKAYALIRTFGTLHLRSAFRCWEAYFLTATDRQRMSLVSLMIQLNALFPDWQVLQWESLLEALEMKTPIDILDEFTRSSPTENEYIKGASGASNGDGLSNHQHDQQTAESENVKVLMLTLALQMLSNHLSIEPSQISRLKFILVQQMDFQDCQLFNDGGEITIDFGPLNFNPKSPSRVAVMLACVRGLKKIMDSFAPLPAETVATLASDSVEQNKVNLSENSSPGVHFIDVVLKMMNSGIDMTKLGQMMLKAWLEIVLIVVYKHNILEREYEQDIVSCMKQIIDLLTEEISEENKLLILEILKCLLRRSDHLTAMVLSKQILALGKLMTKTGVRNSEPVFLKAKQFLKNAFLRFAVAGLFVLMFKNQTVSDSNSGDVDLFFVLRTVIDPDDIIPDEDIRGEIIYLRDQPVRDVIDKLMKQQMDRRSFSTVLHNTSRYVETVHTHPYSENILNDYAGFINALIKHTMEWRRSDWNINPVFTMSAILLKEHPYHHSILLPPIQSLFKHGLQNCTIQAESLVKLMAAYSAISSIPGTQHDNVFVDMIIEELKNYYVINARPNKDTMLTLLQVILWDEKPSGQIWYTKVEATVLGDMIYGHQRNHYFEGKLHPLLYLFAGYLKRSTNGQQFTKKDFKVYSCTAQLLVKLCANDSKQIAIILNQLKVDEAIDSLRFFNWFILTLLKEGEDTLLCDILGYESFLTSLIVKSFNTVDVDFQLPDNNFAYSPANEKLLQCFLLLKAYVLLKLRCGSSAHMSSEGNNNILNSTTFWLTIWPALRRLLSVIDPSTLFASGNVGLSVWNMFSSLLQFLFTSRCEVVMINAFEWSDLLHNLLLKLDEDDHSASHHDGEDTDHLISLDDFKNQVEKLKEMFDVPPIEVPAATMINHLHLELRDIMRFQAESITIQGNNRVLMQTLTHQI